MALTFKANSFSLLMLLVGVGLISGCSTTSVFSAYPSQAQVYREAILTGQNQRAMKDLERKADSKDKLLYRSERGRIHQLRREYEKSQADFDVVIEAYESIDDKARLSAGDVFSTGASLLSNDNAIPYEGYGFERVFLHLFQSFNYLGQGDVEGAGVELRRASFEQRQLELADERMVEKARARAQEEGIDIARSVRGVSEFTAMDRLVSDIKHSFQNAYVFYASAVIWEAMADYNRANVDFRKALELNPGNQTIGRDVKRTAKGRRLGGHQSTIVILYEDGFVPARQSFQFPIPDGEDGVIHTVAFPYYSPDHWPEMSRLSVVVDGKPQGQTQAIAHVGQMAVKALKERVPAMIVRQLLRARAKYELQKQMRERNPLLELTSTLYSMVSERADQRNWLTLPANAQMMRVDVKPGKHQVDFSVGAVQHSMTINARGGRVFLIRAFNPGGRIFAHTYQL